MFPVQTTAHMIRQNGVTFLHSKHSTDKAEKNGNNTTINISCSASRPIALHINLLLN